METETTNQVNGVEKNCVGGRNVGRRDLDLKRTNTSSLLKIMVELH